MTQRDRAAQLNSAHPRKPGRGECPLSANKNAHHQPTYKPFEHLDVVLLMTLWRSRLVSFGPYLHQYTVPSVRRGGAATMNFDSRQVYQTGHLSTATFEKIFSDSSTQQHSRTDVSGRYCHEIYVYRYVQYTRP